MLKANIIATGFLLLTLAGCRETSVFEKRYIRIEIPGYSEQDYVHLLDSSDIELRYLALANLIEMDALDPEKLGGEMASIQQKIQSLLSDPSPKVRSIAAFSANSFETKTFEKLLLKLTHDSSSAVRLEAVSALGKKYFHSSDAVRAILNHLDDDNVLVRLQAIESLARCKKSTLRTQIEAELLVRLPKANRIEQLKIIETLGSVGEPDKEVELVLLNMLDSNEKPIITTAINALGRLKIATAVKKFHDLMGHGAGNQEAMIHALSSIGTSEAVQLLVMLLDNDDQETRIAAIQAIGESEGDQGLKELVNKFSKEKQKVMKEVDAVKWADLSSYTEFSALMDAVKAKILKTQDNIKEPSIIKLLNSESEHETMVGLLLLTEGEPYDRVIIQPAKEVQNLFPLLERLANDPSPLIQALCIAALGNLTDSRALPILETAIENPSFGIRYAAIQAIGNYASGTSNYTPLHRLHEMREKFVPTIYADKDKDYLIRQLIETVIAQPESEYITRQRRMGDLTSSSNPTRLIAALWLSEKKDDVAIPPLLNFLEGGKIGEQTAALNGLEEFPSIPTDVISQLQAIKKRLQDETLKTRIDQVVQKTTQS